MLELAEEREQAEHKFLAVRSRNFALRRRTESLENNLRLQQNGTRVPIPETLDCFQDWCEENLAGSVAIHNRAYCSVKKSEYEDVKLIYQALLVLKDHYVPMRRTGKPGLREAFEEACSKLGLKESESIVLFLGCRE